MALSNSEFLAELENVKLCAGLRGWERDTKKMYPTLTRSSPEEAWGFSVMVGGDIGENTAHWSGVVAYRHDRGIYCRVSAETQEFPWGISVK